MERKENIKAFRTLNKLTQEQLAKELNISKTSYSNKENGKTEFTLKEAKRMSVLFQRSIEEIFFKENVNLMNTKEEKYS